MHARLNEAIHLLPQQVGDIVGELLSKKQPTQKTENREV